MLLSVCLDVLMPSRLYKKISYQSLLFVHCTKWLKCIISRFNVSPYHNVAPDLTFFPHNFPKLQLQEFERTEMCCYCERNTFQSQVRTVSFNITHKRIWILNLSLQSTIQSSTHFHFTWSCLFIFAHTEIGCQGPKLALANRRMRLNFVFGHTPLWRIERKKNPMRERKLPFSVTQTV